MSTDKKPRVRIGTATVTQEPTRPGLIEVSFYDVTAGPDAVEDVVGWNILLPCIPRVGDEIVINDRGSDAADMRGNDNGPDWKVVKVVWLLTPPENFVLPEYKAQRASEPFGVQIYLMPAHDF